jgi:hypothetical protein
MTTTAGAFVSNAVSRAHTRTAFAQNATCGTVGAVTRGFAPVHTVASPFSQHVATLSIAHGLAECSRATLLSLGRTVCDASSPSPRPSVRQTEPGATQAAAPRETYGRRSVGAKKGKGRSPPAKECSLDVADSMPSVRACRSTSGHRTPKKPSACPAPQ